MSGEDEKVEAVAQLWKALAEALFESGQRGKLGRPVGIAMRVALDGKMLSFAFYTAVCDVARRASNDAVRNAWEKVGRLVADTTTRLWGLKGEGGGTPNVLL